MRTAQCFEVYTPDGSLICRVYFTQREIPGKEESAPAAETAQPVAKNEQPENGDMMTAPQKRMLFRLMAVQGFDGEKAQEELRKRFRVNSLQEVSKHDASRMIDHLQKNGGKGHGSSFE